MTANLGLSLNRLASRYLQHELPQDIFIGFISERKYLTATLYVFKMYVKICHDVYL